MISRLLLASELVLVVLSHVVIETRHARVCSDHVVTQWEFQADDYSDGWLLAWLLVMTLRTLPSSIDSTALVQSALSLENYTRIVCMGFVVSTRMSIELGYWPGCPRLLVTCATGISVVALAHSFVCEDDH
jgi:hypothetical protein